MKTKSYIQLKEELSKAARERNIPLFGQFELTGRCNFDCKMCYVHNQKNADYVHKELTTEQWKRIFDEAYDCEMLYATLSGGECLLRKDFKELYLYLWNKNIFVSVLTNGALINDDYIDFFKTYMPDTIQISLYGSNEEGYLNVTGHKGFEKVINAISALQDAGIDVRVVVTPSKFMKDDYIEILKCCKKYGFSLRKGSIHLINSRDNANKNDYFLSQDEIIDLEIQRAELYNTLKPIENTPDIGGCVCAEPEKGLICHAGTSLATVTWDGKMYPCYNAMVGGFSLLEMTYAEAWHKTVQETNKILLGRECKGCPYDKTCPKCPAFRLKDLHSGHCNPEICQLTRKLVAAGVKKLVPVEE